MARKLHEKEFLLRYHLRRAPKTLFERLNPERTERNGKIFVIDIGGREKVSLWVPDRVEVYSSVNIPKQDSRLIFTTRDEGNDIGLAYASKIYTSSMNPSLLDFGWYDPWVSFRLYSVINSGSIDFKKLIEELSAPNSVHGGSYHPLKKI